MSPDNNGLSGQEYSNRKKNILLKIFGPWTFFLIILGVVGYLFFYSDQEDEQQTPPQRPPVAVEIAPVATITLTETVRGIGTLMPAQNVEIKPETAGRIKTIHFREGGFVTEGEILFEIEKQRQVQRLSSSQASLDQARARMANVQRNYERFSRLFEQDLISADDYDRVKTELESVSAEVRRLAAQLELSREDIDDTVIRAPFSGYISRRMVDPGAFVSQGQSLASMYQTDPLEISFTIPEGYSHRVDYGQLVQIHVSSHAEEKLQGLVTFISPSIDVSTRNFEIKASIANPENKLRPGSFASAVLILGCRENAGVVPERSLVATREGYLVFVLDRNSESVESRNVLTGMRRPGLVEILEGLEPEELIIVSGHMNLNHGSKVRVVTEHGLDWAEKDATSACLRQNENSSAEKP